MSMKEKKKVYVKPTITVAKWDFNDDLCETTFRASPCINIRVPGNGGIYAVEKREDFPQTGGTTEGTWSTWPASNN